MRLIDPLELKLSIAASAIVEDGKRIFDIIDEQPIIEERKTGHWIEVNDSYNRISGRCSVCGWESHMYEDDVVGMNYCPNCGARMIGGDGGDQ